MGGVSDADQKSHMPTIMPTMQAKTMFGRPLCEVWSR